MLADAMARQPQGHLKPGLLYMELNGVTDILQVIARPCRVDAQLERIARNLDQLLRDRRVLADADSERRIRAISFVFASYVYLDEIADPQLPVIRRAMHAALI